MWTREVSALPPRKAKNWKGKSWDVSGRLAIIRFVPEGFVTQENDVTHFMEKASDKFKAEIEKTVAPAPDWVPVISRDVVAQRMRSAGTEEFVSHDARMSQAILDGTGLEECHNRMLENMTGNHGPRNHPIAVPTRAGEPVRG